MSDKKHIDRIFQEKFKDFEVAPNPELWNSIQDKLNKPEKDRKKVFPFWYKLAGVAALLLLFLTVGNLLVNNNSIIKTNNTKVVDTENTSKDSSNPSAETDINSTVANTSNEETNKNAIENTTSNSQINNKISNQEETLNGSQIASENGTQTKSFNQINNKASKKSSNNNGVTNPSTVKNPSAETQVNDTRLTENSNAKNKAESDTNSDKDPAEINTNTQIENKNNIAETQTKSNDNKTDSHLEFDKTKTDQQIQPLKNNTTENGIALEENTDVEIEKTVEVELNKTDLTIEEAIAANQDIIEEEKDDIINRWQVYANIAPVYYNSMGNGSHIDAQFDGNSKTGEVNTSYGVNVSYNLNKKLSVRTGLSSLNLSYDTNDVILYESIASNSSAPSALRNINLSKGHETLTALSAENLSVQQVDNSLSPKSNAAISQRISYYEIPMELNYRIGNNKFGLNLIAGFSSFVLDGNEVYSELNDEKTYIGEANNIKSMSFSTNVGVGLDYKFTEKFKFNLEPTFKYQLNAFENTSGSFNPYIIGVYTGFSYKF